MKRFSIGSAITAGIMGTLAMTAMMYMTPLIGLPKMDLIEALGQALPIGLPVYVTGGFVHLGIGVSLAIVYALAFATWLPGSRPVKGALYSILPWIFAMVALAPAIALLHSLLPAAANRTSPQSLRRSCQPLRRGGGGEPVWRCSAKRGSRAECDAPGDDEPDGPLALRCRRWGGLPREGRGVGATAPPDLT